MKITVEVNSLALHAKGEQGHPEIAIVTDVVLDDERAYHIERRLREDEINSRFDIIWSCLGAQITRSFNKGLEEKLLRKRLAEIEMNQR